MKSRDAFELSVIPGLLQTADYARAILQYARHAPIDVEERVHARLSRQAVLTEGAPPTCVFLIDEYALHRSAGEREVMCDRLMRLRELAERPDLIVQVIPYGTRYYAGCPFMIATLDGREVAYQDGALGGCIIESHDKVAEMTRIWHHIRSVALPENASMALVEGVAQEWKT